MTTKTRAPGDATDDERRQRTAQVIGGLRLGLTVGAALILLALVIAMLAAPA